MSEYARQSAPKPRLEDLDPTDTLFDPALTEPEASELTFETAEEAAGRRLDEEADKLGNYDLARERLGIPAVAKEDDELPLAMPKAPRKPRPTGRHTVEPSGRDVSRMIANAEPSDERSPNERRESARMGKLLARAALPHPADLALNKLGADIAKADPDYRDRDERQAWSQYEARMRQINGDD